MLTETHVGQKKSQLVNGLHLYIALSSLNTPKHFTL